MLAEDKNMILSGRALGQDALQCAPMHAKPACRFRDIALA